MKSNNQKDLIIYAINSYSFILPLNGEFTTQFWADEIDKVYNNANLKNKVITNEIRKLKGTIIRRNGVTDFKQF